MITPNTAFFTCISCLTLLPGSRKMCVAARYFPRQVSIVLTVTTASWEPVHAVIHNSRKPAEISTAIKKLCVELSEKINENEVQFLGDTNNLLSHWSGKTLYTLKMSNTALWGCLEVFKGITKMIKLKLIKWKLQQIHLLEHCLVNRVTLDSVMDSISSFWYLW